MEDYLEVISELVDMKGYAATLDISRYMNVSAPSVTKMLKKLDAEGFLEYEKYYGINLTEKGQRIADMIKQKHGILLDFFEILGIGKEIANQDAEGTKFLLFSRNSPNPSNISPESQIEYTLFFTCSHLETVLIVSKFPLFSNMVGPSMSIQGVTAHALPGLSIFICVPTSI